MYKPRGRNKAIQEDNPATIMLTVGEACQLLNVHGNTLRRWSAMGLIKEYRVGPGRHRRFKAEDIAALIVEQHRWRRLKADKTSRQLL